MNESVEREKKDQTDKFVDQFDSFCLFETNLVYYLNEIFGFEIDCMCLRGKKKNESKLQPKKYTNYVKLMNWLIFFFFFSVHIALSLSRVVLLYVCDLLNKSWTINFMNLSVVRSGFVSSFQYTFLLSLSRHPTSAFFFSPSLSLLFFRLLVLFLCVDFLLLQLISDFLSFFCCSFVRSLAIH